MSLPISYDSDNKALALETEIRKLKMELLKQELDDKLLTLRTYLENKKQNETTTTPQALVAEEESTESSYFGNVLFAKVAGNVQVWQLVLVLLVIWMLLRYLKRFLTYQREQQKKELLIKLKRDEKLKKSPVTKNPLLSVEKYENKNSEIDVNKLKTGINNPMLYTNPSFYESLDSNYSPFRREFFLYTINENEVVTNKSFNTVRNKQTSNLAVAAKLSKSDTNLNGLKR